MAKRFQAEIGQSVVFFLFFLNFQTSHYWHFCVTQMEINWEISANQKKILNINLDMSNGLLN